MKYTWNDIIWFQQNWILIVDFSNRMSNWTETDSNKTEVVHTHRLRTILNKHPVCKSYHANWHDHVMNASVLLQFFFLSLLFCLFCLLLLCIYYCMTLFVDSFFSASFESYVWHTKIEHKLLTDDKNKMKSSKFGAQNPPPIVEFSNKFENKRQRRSGRKRETEIIVCWTSVLKTMTKKNRTKTNFQRQICIISRTNN